MHESIPERGRWLKQAVSGFFAYHAVPTNSRALSAFRHYVTDRWRRTLRRRSQKDDMTWADHSDRRRHAPATPNPSSMARSTLWRPSPKVGAECPNRARSVLCGGCPVTGIPTAILGRRAKSAKEQPKKCPSVQKSTLSSTHGDRWRFECQNTATWSVSAACRSGNRCSPHERGSR
jgi:hypothetical protein